ncbi:hypothetical protein EVAR_54010_1 [Eumeta japonica]|uniref:Uncharacterized protein n=1 Tax=Eumeta variegata TaxID=151549 RepID=A0A4C1XRD9_EUMVA|nr:hypothetical protein EVAR_54010_1 [Eumeta japonica]
MLKKDLNSTLVQQDWERDQEQPESLSQPESESKTEQNLKSKKGTTSGSCMAARAVNRRLVRVFARGQPEIRPRRAPLLGDYLRGRYGRVRALPEDGACGRLTRNSGFGSLSLQ